MLYNLFENRDFVSVFAVALLAEGVDRNWLTAFGAALLIWVALLAEGVDRNNEVRKKFAGACESPSSQRAWIEILRGNQRKHRKKRRPPRRGRG